MRSVLDLLLYFLTESAQKHSIKIIFFWYNFLYITYTSQEFPKSISPTGKIDRKSKCPRKFVILSVHMTDMLLLGFFFIIIIQH
jgi:hypothetical protein